MSFVLRESHIGNGTFGLGLFAAVALAFLLIADKPPLTVSGEITGVHDPAIIAIQNNYLLFATGEAHPGHIPIRCSTDLFQWSLCGRLFEQLPAWAAIEIPGAKTIWAPDISKYSGEYRVYYAVSTFGHNDSAIGLAVNTRLDARVPSTGWVDKGMVLRSHQGQDDWNAIDPNLATDDRKRQWLVFGSFWSGIKMRRIEPATGLLDQQDTTLYSLAERPHSKGLPDAIEAPFIVKHGRFYYLFVSFDFCCRGAKSSYNVVVGRATAITGPYGDAEGRAMLAGGGTSVVSGTDRWRGPGHVAVLQGKEGDFLVFHAYSGQNGKPSWQIAPLTWPGGWPRVSW